MSPFLLGLSFRERRLAGTALAVERALLGIELLAEELQLRSHRSQQLGLFDLRELFASRVEIENGIPRGHHLSDGGVDGDDPPADYGINRMMLAMNLEPRRARRDLYSNLSLEEPE